MKQPKFKMDNIEYLFIFDYYDSPLSFITKKINGNYYFLYFIDFGTYFSKPLSIKDIILLFSNIPTKDILNVFLKDSNSKIIEQESNGDGLFLKSIKEYELERNLIITDYFPSDDSKFESDFVSGHKFPHLTDNYEKYFPDLFKNKNLTIKLIDNNNSHSSDPDIIVSTIELIKTFIKGHKEYLKDSLTYPNEVLQIKSFSPGSFNINFELSQPEETTLFEFHDEQTFDEFILFFDSLGDVSPEEVYENYIFENKDIVKATEDFYKNVKKSQVKIELINSKKTKFSTLTYSDKIDEYFEEFASLATKNEVAKTIEEEFNFKGTVASASKRRNHITIELIDSVINAKFTRELFSEIKNQEKIVSISKEMGGKYKKTISLDNNNNEVGVKYEIFEYKQ